MDVSIVWWLLVTAGIALVIAEVFIGAFIVMWFGLGAVVAGLLTFFVPGLNAGIQLLLTALLGAVLLYFFRDRCIAGENASQESLHTFSRTTGEIHKAETGAMTVFANGTFWQIGNPEDIPEEKRKPGSTIRVAEFRNNKAYVSNSD